MSEELENRLKRVYAALDATLEYDINKTLPVVHSDSAHIRITQDFMGSLTDSDVENLAYSIIHNLANLCDHTRGWLIKNGKAPQQVDQFISANQAVAIINDLSNNDKHGYPPRNRGFSGKAPKLDKLRRVMRISSGATPGSGMGYFISPSGEQTLVGSGSAPLIITGAIQDAEGNSIGDLHSIQVEALNAWEGLFCTLGLIK